MVFATGGLGVSPLRLSLARQTFACRAFLALAAGSVGCLAHRRLRLDATLLRGSGGLLALRTRLGVAVQ